MVCLRHPLLLISFHFSSFHFLSNAVTIASIHSSSFNNDYSAIMEDDYEYDTKKKRSKKYHPTFLPSSNEPSQVWPSSNVPSKEPTTGRLIVPMEASISFAISGINESTMKTLGLDKFGHVTHQFVMEFAELQEVRMSEFQVNVSLKEGPDSQGLERMLESAYCSITLSFNALCEENISFQDFIQSLFQQFMPDFIDKLQISFSSRVNGVEIFRFRPTTIPTFSPNPSRASSNIPTSESTSMNMKTTTAAIAAACAAGSASTAAASGSASATTAAVTSAARASSMVSSQTSSSARAKGVAMANLQKLNDNELIKRYGTKMVLREMQAALNQKPLLLRDFRIRKHIIVTALKILDTSTDKFRRKNKRQMILFRFRFLMENISSSTVKFYEWRMEKEQERKKRILKRKR